MRSGAQGRGVLSFEINGLEVKKMGMWVSMWVGARKSVPTA